MSEKVKLLPCQTRKHGTGTVTKDGYIRVSVKQKDTLQHHVVWTKVNGPIPTGMHIHHKDGDESNNELSNLQLVTPEEHRRIHMGFVKDSAGIWWKECKRCHILKKAETDFQEVLRSDRTYRKSFLHICRECIPAFNRERTVIRAKTKKERKNG